MSKMNKLIICILMVMSTLLFVSCTGDYAEINIKKKEIKALEEQLSTQESGERKTTENDVKEALKVPLKYNADAAIKNGDIVNLHGEITNIDRFKAFIKNIDSGKTDLIRITSYTVEGDPIITVVYYDGNKIECYEDNTRDAFGGEKGIRHSSGKEIIAEKEEVKYDDGEKYEITNYKLIGSENQVWLLSTSEKK